MVQRLHIDDIHAATQLSKTFYNTMPDEKKLRKFLEEDKNYLLMYKEGAKIAGYAYGYELLRFDGQESMLYVHAVEVLPEYRRKGIGRELLNEFSEICKGRKFIKMFLITEKSNAPAVSLYGVTGGKEKHDDYTVFEYEI